MADEVPTGWQEGPQIAAGGFATVIRCLDSDGHPLPIVAKKMNIISEQLFLDARNEIIILRKLSHENIVRYYGCDSVMDTMYIFMEYVPGGTLTELVKSSGPLSEERTRRYTRHILKGLSYLHSQNVIHRDIKGGNILLDERDMAKLADFGISKILCSTGTLSGAVSEQVGTLCYMSPEMLNEDGYGRRTDVWSLGCTIVEMLTGNPPWHDLTLVELVKKISAKQRPQYDLPPEISDSARDMLNKCFVWSKNHRPYTEQLMKHDFVKEEKGEKRGCHCRII